MGLLEVRTSSLTPCTAAGPPPRAICLRAYCPGIDGDFQRPGCCISTTQAPAAARDCADPTRRLCPLTRPATPASDDPLCWRVPLACVSSALRSEERRLYLDITNVCEDKLYMSVCFEIENPIDVEINSSCDEFALRPGGKAEVFAWKMEKPTERYEIKAFGVKDGRYGRYRQCLDLIPGFDDVPF